MEEELLSTTAISPVPEFVTQENSCLPAVSDRKTLEVRVLTEKEKKELKDTFGINPALSWYGFCINGDLVAGDVSLQKLLGRMRRAGYTIHDLDALA